MQGREGSKDDTIALAEKQSLYNFNNAYRYETGGMLPHLRNLTLKKSEFDVLFPSEPLLNLILYLIPLSYRLPQDRLRTSEYDCRRHWSTDRSSTSPRNDLSNDRARHRKSRSRSRSSPSRLDPSLRRVDHSRERPDHREGQDDPRSLR